MFEVGWDTIPYMKTINECLVKVIDGDILALEYDFDGELVTDVAVARFSRENLLLKNVIGKGEVANTKNIEGSGLEVLTDIKGNKVALLSVEELRVRHVTARERRAVRQGLESGRLRVSHE